MDTKKLRQKILDLAIRGKLVPQDPNDEPASVLLERIRAEKERLIKEGKIKRSKKSASDTPHYENRQVGEANEVPFEVPESWEWTTIEDVTVNRDSERIPLSLAVRKKQQNKIYDYYGAAGVIDKVENYLFDERLLLVGEDGANLLSRSKDNAFFAEGKYWVNNHAHVLDCPSKSVLDYIAFVINSMSLEDYITGSAQPKLTQDNLNKILIPLPPEKEQHRIIESVNNFFSYISFLEGEIEEMDSFILKAKSKVLDLAIHGKLVPQDSNDEPAIELLKRINPKFTPCDNAHYENIPEGWTKIKVGELAQYTNGKAFQPSDWEQRGLPIIRIQNLNDENCKYNYTSIDHEEKYKITNGDLLFAWAASLGVYIWKGDDAWLNQHIFKVEPLPFIDKQFLYYLFQYLISEFYNRSHGSGMVHITKKEFETTIALLPPLSEQLRIVRSIESYYGALNNISANL